MMEKMMEQIMETHMTITVATLKEMTKVCFELMKSGATFEARQTRSGTEYIIELTGGF